MDRLAIIITIILIVSGCTTIHVNKVDASKNQILLVCIEKNPSVLVTDFVGVVERGFMRHGPAESLLRPDVGTQAQFRKKKPHATYRYDSSLDPAISWDERNAKMKNSTSLTIFLAHRWHSIGISPSQGSLKPV